MSISALKHNFIDANPLNSFSQEKEMTVSEELSFYGEQDSYLLSQVTKMRATQFDVLLLFFEIMKLDISSREQETLSRREERLSQLSYMQEIVENRKAQASALQTAGLATGLFSIASAIIPLVGYTSGDWILQKLSSITNKFNGMERDKFFDSAAKITQSLAEGSRTGGEIRKTFAEGDLTRSQTLSDLHRSNWDENTRVIEEHKEAWKSLENFLYQSLQMNHETILGLYR